MAVTFFPFNSIVVDGVPDRPANAENLAAYLAGFFSNGVIMQEDTALKVEAYSGMDVQIRAGMGNINGKTILADAAEIITLDTASASLNRIDRVVFRLDEVNRCMEFDVLTGTPAADPVAPELTRGADIYEMCLAEIRVPAGASTILANYITDTRTDAELCGTASIPAHMQDIKHGGTGADNPADARNNLNCIGKDTIEFGFIGTESIKAQSYRDVTITFSKVFSKAPRVFLQLGSTSTSADLGSISVALTTFPTTAGFSVRIYNDASASRSPTVHWTAIECD